MVFVDDAQEFLKFRASSPPHGSMDGIGSTVCPAQAHHIVDFRDGSWYREDVYDFLRPWLEIEEGNV